MKASDFDKKFDEGVEDIMEDLDMSTATRPLKELRRVNVDFPRWMVERLDQEADRLGVTRQALIKIWIADRLEKSSCRVKRQLSLPAPADRLSGDISGPLLLGVQLQYYCIRVRRVAHGAAEGSWH
jgi:hypothetical protein